MTVASVAREIESGEATHSHGDREFRGGPKDSATYHVVSEMCHFHRGASVKWMTIGVWPGFDASRCQTHGPTPCVGRGATATDCHDCG